ncbi:hypothetical protein SUGI_0793320 [Cryptomeria japonica]|uniref:uncharacterized protein LOC131078569 isoform X1 n=1 Tax=Cryptomeria japonica TaxID=3369 RepID=UPI00241492D8|nr:uncharacterized protein LOC131078569 isoform X1 [Cryptomeria japonica]GLJ38915.1 hypothetical protein SUGI_0793320 [Cryptomeria japonica]
MEEEQFRKILNQFPVVRSRDYRAEDEAGSKKMLASSERDNQVMDWHDAWKKLDAEETAVERSEKEGTFWMHLRSSVEQKMGAENAEQFCRAFQKVHEQLVYRALPLDAIRRITAHLESNSS